VEGSPPGFKTWPNGEGGVALYRNGAKRGEEERVALLVSRCGQTGGAQRADPAFWCRNAQTRVAYPPAVEMRPKRRGGEPHLLLSKCGQTKGVDIRKCAHD